MIDSLFAIYHRLIEGVQLKHYRYLYHRFSINNRLTGLLGARGVGKTTLMLQYIKNHFAGSDEVFYFSADHIYFSTHTLYGFVEELFLQKNITTFFIDEIHKYKNWNQELKNLYDGFPKIKIIFSGSSSLDLVKGSYDLSRRAIHFNLPGLSFREYLNFETNSQFEPLPFMDVIHNTHGKEGFIANIPKIKGHFQEYLRRGFYPFYAEDNVGYYERLLQTIEKIIFEDIANFYRLKTENLQHFNKILMFLASIPPGTSNVHNIAKNLSIDDKTITNYLSHMEEIGLINLIYSAETGNIGLRRPQKIFLNNTNLQYALEGNLSKNIDIGTVRELFFIQSIKNAGLEIFHSKNGDYQVKDCIFEIGGKNKTNAQIKKLQNAYLIKDDTWFYQSNAIPLMYFGFIY